MTSAASLLFSPLIRHFPVTGQVNEGRCVSNIILIEGGFLGSTLHHLKSNMKYDGAVEPSCNQTSSQISPRGPTVAQQLNMGILIQFRTKDSSDLESGTYAVNVENLNK